MAKAMTKLLSARHRAHHLGHHAEGAGALRQRIRQPIALLQQLVGRGSCSARSRSRSTASGSESDSASACSAMLGATSQPRRPGPAAGPQRMRPSKPCRATGCACSASSSRRGSARRTGWTRTAARESRRPARRRCTAAPRRQDGRLHHGAVGDLLVVVRRCWLGHASPQMSTRGTTDHAAL